MAGEQTDEFLWLEDIEGQESLAWVERENNITLDGFSKTPGHQKTEADLLEILSTDQRIPYGTLHGDYIYNYWQDKNNIRGILRRAKFNAYIDKNTNWETVIDLDRLSADEDEQWVFKKLSVLEPTFDRALIFLSRGGKDATVIREFDLTDFKFIDEGFNFSESKSDAIWVNKNEILLSSGLKETELTSSGYPRVVNLLKRSKEKEETKILFEGDIDNVLVSANLIEINDRKYGLITKTISFFEKEYYISDLSGSLYQLPIPKSSILPSDLTSSSNLHNNNLIVLLKTEWNFEERNYANNSAISINLEEFIANNKIVIKPVFTPKYMDTVTDIAITEDHVYLSLLHDVKNCLKVISFNDNASIVEDVHFPGTGTVKIQNCSKKENTIIASYEDFITPTYLSVIKDKRISHVKIKELSPLFNNASYSFKQNFAISRDGTKIPYFVIMHKKNSDQDNHPTMMYGYGGFDISITPAYLSAQNFKWVESGGVYVVANIRGGGEYGSDWHKSAQYRNKHKSYEDFIAVAEDLIENKITSSQKLAIQGGSNGGLLMGAMLTQRPDLFGAIICQVPLLDMMRYHKLLAGASWVGEYGNPDNIEDRSYLLSYSPYQNLKENDDYPPVFFTTSTKDDRVHPGHARKMVARMKSMNHKTWYFENKEGGHGGASTPKQQAKIGAFILSFLTETII